MAEDTCIVCGRPGALPVVHICPSCLQFAGDTFSALTQMIRSRRVPVDRVDWSGLVESAQRATSRSAEISEKSDQVAQIVENASRIATTLDTVYEEVSTAERGGEPDLDRVAGAIDDGIVVLFGNDASSRIVQAGIRASLDVLAGDQPVEVLKDVLRKVLPGWMLTDLWIAVVFAQVEAKPAAPQAGEGGQPLADLAEDLDGLARKFIERFRAAGTEEETRSAVDAYFDELARRLRGAGEPIGKAWLASFGTESFGRNIGEIYRQGASDPSASAESDQIAAQRRFMKAIDQGSNPPPGLEYPYGMRPTPGDPAWVDLIVAQRPDLPYVAEYVEATRAGGDARKRYRASRHVSMEFQARAQEFLRAGAAGRSA
jgi:hypothetical protein